MEGGRGMGLVIEEWFRQSGLWLELGSLRAGS
jgi:hypothetical protein